MSNFVETRISEFWQWFVRADPFLYELYSSAKWEELGELLRQHLDQLKPNPPRLNWEIGIRDEGNLYFAICPTTAANISLAKLIVERAPTMHTWTVVLGRQPKPESVRVSLTFQAISGQARTFNCSMWQFIARETDDSSPVDIVIVPDALPQDVTEVDRTRLAYVVLDNFVGEMVCLQRVRTATIIVKEMLPAGTRTLPLGEIGPALVVKRAKRESKKG